MSGHTPGPWLCGDGPEGYAHRLTDVHTTGATVCDVAHTRDARLIAAAPELLAELQRYLPVLERAEADPAVWIELTQGTGIATANGYRHAIARATGASA